jgi:DNA-binding Lrp family transcriptional regulator
MVMVRAVMLVRSPRTLVAERVKKLSGVKDAFDTAGRFDCIVLAELSKLVDIKSLAMQIQKIEGVKRTETLVQLE